MGCFLWAKISILSQNVCATKPTASPTSNFQHACQRKPNEKKIHAMKSANKRIMKKKEKKYGVKKTSSQRTWANTTFNAVGRRTGKPNPLKIEFPFYIRGDIFFLLLWPSTARSLFATHMTIIDIIYTAFVDSIIAVGWRDGSELTQTQSR